MSNKVYFYNGLSGSLKSLCIKLDISYNAITQRIHRGMSIEEALSTPTYKKYKVQNEIGTLTYFCRKFNCNYQKAKKLIEQGYSIRYSLIHSQKLHKEFEYKGIKTKTLTELCNIFDKNLQTIRGRINSGWSIEEAFENNQNNHLLYITYKGETDSLSNLCKKYNKSRNLVYGRISRGWSIEEAFESPIKEKPKYTFNGFTGNIKQICNHFNLDYFYIKTYMATHEKDIEKAVVAYNKRKPRIQN